MNPKAAEAVARELMDVFAVRTGLTSDSPPRRYLWTDAFAVCNFLALYRRTERIEYERRALQLAEQVHHVLGRHRDDDPREGWISGSPDEEGRRHPTRGGLRIGKNQNERKPSEPPDPRGEWDRDGQYFHYLTKWMLALLRLYQITGEETYHAWAVELARAGHSGFTYTAEGDGARRMYWKMSIDLSYPLVKSMGQHDPLDGLITFSELDAYAPHEPEMGGEIDLSAEIEDMDQMAARTRFATRDPLGIGGLLVYAYRVARLVAAGHVDRVDLLADLMSASVVSLDHFAESNLLDQSAQRRLAFRELGLAIGLQAVEPLRTLIVDHAETFHGSQRGRADIEALTQHVPAAETIEAFWLEPANRDVDSWTQHLDINAIMLATCLIPGGYLMTEEVR